MRSSFLRFCSLLLTAVLLVNMLPLDILAADTLTEEALETTEISTAEEVQIVEEITQNRSAYIKEFQLSSGLHMAAVYPEAVHYQEDGQWKDIDNTLISTGTGLNAQYKNTAGVWDVRFPRQMAGNRAVTVTKDGCTLSFYMSGELRSSGEVMRASAGASAEMPEEQAETFAVSQAQAATAQVEQVDVSALKAGAEYPETVSEKLHSRVQYANVYQNTNIVYDLRSNTLKESIVMGSYSAGLRGYKYTLDVGSLLPVLTESGEIQLYDAAREETVMVMPAPYLVDAAGEYSHDVTVNLTGSESNYTLTYQLPTAWLAADSRQWPVVLDPMIEANPAASNMQDRRIAEYNNYHHSTDGILEVGYDDTYGITRSYVMYDELPSLTSADVIVSASIEMYSPTNSTTAVPIEVHKVSGTWTSAALTWANKPGFDETIVDYAIHQGSGFYTWEVTDIVREWYEGENTGMMFKASNGVETAAVDNWTQFYASDYGQYEPALTITFRNNNGLESYWDYTTASAGRAGTGYVNNYTGNLVWVHEDLSFGGTRMPVSIRHIYNAGDSREDRFGMGMGWRTNYNQLVYPWSENSNYYVWEDADGTRHYFLKESTGVYKDEDGLELTLTVSGTNKIITDKYGNTSHFDSEGRLYKLENSQQSKSSIKIAYMSSTSKQIHTIHDGVDRVYTFGYTNGLATRLSYDGKGTSELDYLSFTYSGSKLTGITYKDGKTSSFFYWYNSFLSQAQDIDGHRVNWLFNTTTLGQPNRISWLGEYYGSTEGNTLSFEYSNNQTKLTDHKSNVQIMQFNNWGNTVSIQDGLGRAQYAKYAINTQEELENNTDPTVRTNQLRLSSKLQNTVGNRIKDSSFEYGNVWTSLSSDISNYNTQEAAYLGYRSLKIVNSSNTSQGVVSDQFLVKPGESYTFSAYVKSGTSSVQLGFKDALGVECEEVLKANNDWTRVEATYTNTGNTDRGVMALIVTVGTSTVYMDCVQVEHTESASRYNLVDNGDFRHGSEHWYLAGGYNTATEHRVSSEAAAVTLDDYAYSITGSPTAQKRLCHAVKLSGSAGETFIVAGWAKGDSAPLTGSRKFGLMVSFYHTDGSSADKYIPFNPDTDSTESWQYLSGPVVADKAYSEIYVRCVYDYNVNTVQFDGIQLYREEFGNTYAYDNSGNVVSVVDLQKKTTTYQYTNNNLTKEILPSGAVLTYTYDNYHNVKTATSAEGMSYYFNYDSYGNNTSVAVMSGSTSLISTAVYTSDKNRLTSTTDATGKTTYYSYNENTNVLEWVQYPEDTAATRTNYTYDNLNRLERANATTDTGSALTAAYAYTNDYLASITTGSTTYNFSYGTFGNRTAISIGSRTLATYSYTDRYSLLSSLDYGNGDRVNYTYDNYGRLTAQIYEDGDTVSYQYNNDGDLASTRDSETGITTRYYYDFLRRAVRYTESSDSVSHAVEYTYDTRNNLTVLKDTVNGTLFTTAYAYDDDNRIASITNGVAGRSYTYDAYGRMSRRVTTHHGTAVTTETYTFTNPSGTTTSGQTASQNIVSNGYNKSWVYSYDDNGNIVSITDKLTTTSYVYDSANQLIRENNEEAGKTWTYTYDDAGNILSKKTYAYTTGTLGTPTGTASYTYDDTWGDLLTEAYGGMKPTDEIGNLISDGAWTYTWQHGRELVNMSRSDGTSWDFTYNADGLRTKRTNGSRTWVYTYSGSKLSHVTVDGQWIYFTYSADGKPVSLIYNGTLYYYVTNLQGDVAAILNSAGAAVVEYTYDAWGNPLSTTGSMASTLGFYNPLRYRGYVYDADIGLYYLQSRYYSPGLGRFISADAYAATGQGLIGNNMFAYCLNNPVNYADFTGESPVSLVLVYLGAIVGGAIGGSIIGAVSHLVTNGLTGTPITSNGVWSAIGMGALTGGLGGAAGTSGKMLQTALSAVVGIIAGCYTANNTEGELPQKIITGAAVGIIAAASTYAGASIDTQNLTALATGFANFATTLFVATPAEILAVASQQAISGAFNSTFLAGPNTPIYKNFSNAAYVRA